jgi:uncharacterized protein YceH (UPF0502 family)
MPAMPHVHLEPVEARVLGVLVEKALTTPEQYPLSLNALVNGCNQKNNRDPLLSLSEREVNDVILKLRVAGLVEFVQLAGQRVEKYRHRAGEALHLEPAEVAVLAELLLRGSQQPGELRTRVERMHALPTQADLERVLDAMAGKGMVRRFERRPGERVERWGQLLAREEAGWAKAGAEAVGDVPAAPQPAAMAAPAVARVAGGLEGRVAALEAEVASLRERLQALAAKGGETVEPD